MADFSSFKIERQSATIVERLRTLPTDVLSYVDFVAWRSHQSSDTNRSAEARAIDRLPDEDNPQMWVTVMNPGDYIDQNAYDRLRRLGYVIEVPLKNL